MKFEVYSRRWNHFDSYEIQKTPAGWWVNFMEKSGSCDTSGQPFLFENLEHDGINYPERLGEYFEYLWKNANTGTWNEKKIQPKLNILSKWVMKTELSSPKRGIWKNF